MVGFVIGVLTVFFDVSYMSYLPSLRRADEILEGNSKLEISRTVAQTAGPALGGGLIGVVGAPLAILADSLSFLASAAFVTRIRTPRAGARRPPGRARRSPRRASAGRSPTACATCFGNRYLRTIAASTATSNLFSNIAFSTYLVYVVRDLGLDVATIGVVLGIGNLGAILGAVTATRLGRRFGVGPVIVGAMFLIGRQPSLVPLASRPWAIPMLLTAQALIGFAAVVYNVNQVSLRQAITPERMQGRMNATMRFIVWGTIPIGATIGGVIATAVGVTQALWVGGILSCTAFLPVFLGPVRRLREFPSATTEPPARRRSPRRPCRATSRWASRRPARSRDIGEWSGEEGGDPDGDGRERQRGGHGEDGGGE